MTDDAFVALAPVVMFTAPVVLHVLIFVPALATGAGTIVSVFVDTTSGQPPLVAVNVIVTLPAAISAPLGV